jgi:hypothetical protein
MIETWLWAGRPRGRSSSPSRVKNFHFSTSSRPALGPTQPPIQWVPVALSTGVKRPRRETDHSPPTIAEVKKCGIIHPVRHTPWWHSAYLVKHRANYTFYLNGTENSVFEIKYFVIRHIHPPPPIWSSSSLGKLSSYRLPPSTSVWLSGFVKWLYVCYDRLSHEIAS